MGCSALRCTSIFDVGRRRWGEREPINNKKSMMAYDVLSRRRRRRKDNSLLLLIFYFYFLFYFRIFGAYVVCYTWSPAYAWIPTENPTRNLAWSCFRGCCHRRDYVNRRPRVCAHCRHHRIQFIQSFAPSLSIKCLLTPNSSVTVFCRFKSLSQLRFFFRVFSYARRCRCLLFDFFLFFYNFLNAFLLSTAATLWWP